MGLECRPKIRRFLLTWWAPAGPEDDPDRSTTQIGEADRTPIQISEVDVLPAVLP